MLKFILLCVFLIWIVQCLEPIPSASEIRDIVKGRREAIEAEHQRQMEEANEHNRRYFENIERQKEERQRTQEEARVTIRQVMAQYCDAHQEDVQSKVLFIIRELEQSDSMENKFYEISPSIGFCIMQKLMEFTFAATYIPRNYELRVDLDKLADQSRIEMETSELCGDQIIYAIDCGKEEDNCMLFQAEFANCMENEDNYCFNAHDYAGMKEVNRFQPGWICL